MLYSVGRLEKEIVPILRNFVTFSMEEQKGLVAKLYAVHERLRKERRKAKNDEEWKAAWRKHTEDCQTLKEYSASMAELATKIWDPRNTSLDSSSECRLKCRLDWVHQKCREYFHGRQKLKMLDVGSCYNPFKKFGENYDITAVDLCPAPGCEEDVFQCDFLNVKVTERVVDVEGERDLQGFRSIASLAKEGYEIVVFSFFLEYLPDKEQRLESCRKAFDLLKTGGLLFILRPDSGSVKPTGYSQMIKALKIGAGFLGFKRIFFEKLQHVWCIGFTKLSPEDTKEHVASVRFLKDVKKVQENFDFSDGQLSNLFCIPQDFNEGKELVEPASMVVKTHHHEPELEETIMSAFLELPILELEL